MKKKTCTLLVVALVVSILPALADEATQVPVVKNGRLTITEQVLNSDRLSIYINGAGMIISPMPTDPSRLPVWRATQQWLNENIAGLKPLIHSWTLEHATQARPTIDLATHLDQHLQERLAQISAGTEIQAIMQSITVEDDTAPMHSGSSRFGQTETSDPQPTVVAAVCGPNGTPMDAVNCCVQTCEPARGCSTTCTVCDCNPSGNDCCGYGGSNPPPSPRCGGRQGGTWARLMSPQCNDN